MKAFKDPRIWLSVSLLLIFISAVFFYNRTDFLKHLLFTVSLTVIFDLIFLKLRRVDFFIPSAAITSGAIISILLSPSSKIFEIVLASFMAMFSKNFIKGENRHVFNPAGFGILASAVVFGRAISWWAASFQQANTVYFILLLLPALVSMVRLKRFSISVPFLILYSLLSFNLNKTPILNSLTDPTILFFSFVMLPEPQTTPNKTRRQILFGSFVSITAIVASKFMQNPDPLVFSLIAGNLLFYRLK